MQLWADPGPGVDEDDRERDVAVLGADEFVGVLGVLEVVGRMIDPVFRPRRSDRSPGHYRRPDGYRTRVKFITQLTSQVSPPSGEKLCSHRQESAVILGTR